MQAVFSCLGGEDAEVEGEEGNNECHWATIYSLCSLTGRYNNPLTASTLAPPVRNLEFGCWRISKSCSNQEIETDHESLNFLSNTDRKWLNGKSKGLPLCKMTYKARVHRHPEDVGYSCVTPKYYPAS